MHLLVTDRDGREHLVETTPGGSLMEALRELEYGVAAICGGMCSCATCHVYIADDWLDRFPAQHGDERDLVRELEHARANSRLSCQLTLSEALDGLRLALAPQE